MFAICSLHLDVHAEVGNVGAVTGNQVAAVDHVLLRDAHQHVFERNQLGGVFLLDLLQVIAEARFRGAPVSHGVAVRLIGGLELGFVPVVFRATDCP